MEIKVIPKRIGLFVYAVPPNFCVKLEKDEYGITTIPSGGDQFESTVTFSREWRNQYIESVKKTTLLPLRCITHYYYLSKIDDNEEVYFKASFRETLNFSTDGVRLIGTDWIDYFLDYINLDALLSYQIRDYRNPIGFILCVKDTIRILQRSGDTTIEKLELTKKLSVWIGKQFYLLSQSYGYNSNGSDIISIDVLDEFESVEFTRESHKILLLQKLGIIDFLKKKYNPKSNTQLANILGAICDIDDKKTISNIRKNISYLDAGHKKSIVNDKSQTAVEIVIKKLGLS
jgi:hypothetical protein